MDRIFEKFILNEIIKLPISKDPTSNVSYNLILIVVNYLIIYRIFILFKEGLDTK